MGTSGGPVPVRLSVSVASRCSVETADGLIDLVFGWRLLSTSPTLCGEEIQLCTKIRVPRSGIFF